MFFPGSGGKMGSRPLLKQFGELRFRDFEEYPVWVDVHVIDYDEPWYDDTDEETFRPWVDALPVDSETIYLVRAQFILSDGSKRDGIITPQLEGDSPDLGCLQPRLFLDSGEMAALWHGIVRPSEEDRKRCYLGLGGRSAKQVFPVRFVANPKLARGLISGSAAGFCWLDDAGQVQSTF
jgi:hypothetical protein